MKSMLFSSFMIFAYASWSCPQREGQFMGLVRNHQNVTQAKGQHHCSFEIELTSFQPSFVCPLFPGEVSSLRIEDPFCKLTEGDHLNGILVLKDGILTFE